MSCSESSLLDVIARHGGVLAVGSHSTQYEKKNCPLCINEAYAAYLMECGKISQITDNPEELGRPEYRDFNDALWSSREVATPHLVRLCLAFDGWSNLDDNQRLAIASRIYADSLRETSFSPHMMPPPPVSIEGMMHDAMATAWWAAEKASRKNVHFADEVLIRAIDIWVRAAKSIISLET